LNIRRATLEDSAGLARVQVDSYRAAYAGILPASYLSHFTYEEQAQDWRAWLCSETEEVLTLAETDTGEIVGYALARPSAGEMLPYSSELVALHVQRAFQGQGVGKQLFKAIAEQLQQKGCSSLMVWVLEANPARKFYEQLGGQLLGAQKVTEGALEVAYGWAAIESLVCKLNS